MGGLLETVLPSPSSTLIRLSRVTVTQPIHYGLESTDEPVTPYPVNQLCLLCACSVLCITWDDRINKLWVSLCLFATTTVSNSSGVAVMVGGGPPSKSKDVDGEVVSGIYLSTTLVDMQRRLDCSKGYK